MALDPTSQFPTSIDNPPGPTDVTKMNATGVEHDLLHQLEGNMAVAVQTKVGIDGSAETDSHDYKLSGVTGSDKAASKTGTETLTNKTLTSPTINTPIISTPTIRLWDGWIDANETWTYSSATTYTNSNTTRGGAFTISGDLTTKYQAGMRVKFTQNTGGTKYGVITKVSHSGGTTTVTVFFGTSHTLNNEAISSPYYSEMHAPMGFPLTESLWTAQYIKTTDSDQATPVAGTWYNVTNDDIDIPIGEWNLYYQGALYARKVTAVEVRVFATLSDANNTESDKDRSTAVNIAGATGTLVCMNSVFNQKLLSLTADDTYYLNMSTDVSSQSNIIFRGSFQNTTIKAVCNYI